jgi:hypothetical protein
MDYKVKNKKKKACPESPVAQPPSAVNFVPDSRRRVRRGGLGGCPIISGKQQISTLSLFIFRKTLIFTPDFGIIGNSLTEKW